MSDDFEGERDDYRDEPKDWPDPRDKRRKVARIAEALANMPDERIDQIVYRLRSTVNFGMSFSSALADAIDSAAEAYSRDPFFDSLEWKRARYETLVRFGGRCCCCGVDRYSGAILQVDHIKPRSKYPQLALDLSNLQVLCQKCNEGKGNRDETDWRTERERKRFSGK